MAKSDVEEKIDGDSVEQLEQVKKGKPRKFVMISKGTSIVSLVVYKKGSVEKFKKQAKEAGKGQICYGVITGRGVDISFQLSRADGFDKEPVKSLVLKSFLDENAEYKCKPLFEIVDSTGVVLDEDDPLVQRFLKAQEKAKEACKADPDSADRINTLCSQIGSHFDQEQPDAAKSKLIMLESVLQSVVDNASVKPSGDAPPKTSDDASTKPSVDAAAAFTERLKALKPAIDKAQADPKVNPDIKLRVSEAAMFARKQDFAQAGNMLDQVEFLLKARPPAPPLPPTKPSADAAAAFTNRLKTLKPSIDTAMSSPDADPDIKLRVSEAAVFARKQDFVQAGKLLDQVEALIKSAKPSPSSGPAKFSLVKLGKARIEWNTLRKESLKELEQLKAILKDEYAEDEDEQTSLNAAFGKIDTMIATLNEELGDQLDDVLNGDETTRPKLIATAKATLDRFVKFVETDELMQLVDGNEYAPDMQVAAPMGAKLQEIAAALG